MTKRLSLSPEQMRELDAVSAAMRNRDQFRRDVIRSLELKCGLRPISNQELEQAIVDISGIVPLRHL
jgi:hypothetical protein